MIEGVKARGAIKLRDVSARDYNVVRASCQGKIAPQFWGVRFSDFALHEGVGGGKVSISTKGKTNQKGSIELG